MAAYLILKDKTPEEVMEFVKSKHPVTHYWDAQIEALKKFSRL